MQVLRKVWNQCAAIGRAPIRLKISEWADKKAWIPADGNAEPGKYRLSRMPHQAAMLDDPMEPGVREVWWMLASQAGGKTLCLILITEYVIEQLRKSIIMVRATKETALEWMRDKFLPTVAATPCMTGLMAEPRKRDSNSTSTNRKFPGGGLKVLGAKSPASFRGSSAGNIFQDEVDSYVTIKEGDPSALADRAAITFSDAWKIKCSTPTLAGFSKIAEGHDTGDKQKYFLPCPYCGVFQWLKFERVKFSFTPEEYERNGHPNDFTWEIGQFPIKDTKRAIYICESCNRGWTDTQRIQSYMSGHPDNPPVLVNGKELRAEWRATAPFNGIRSRQLSGMYLTIGLKSGMVNYLHQFAEDFLAAKRGGRETLMVWTNIFKSEPFEDVSEKVDWKELKARAEDYGPDLPAQVMWINFAADVHPDRVEILFIGWGNGHECWMLDHRVEFGDFDMPAMQQRVEEYLLNKRFTHPILGEMAVSAGVFDSGKQTKVKSVYKFAAKHRLSNWFSCKGFDQALGAVYQRVSERTYGGTRLNFNVDYLKNTLFDRLHKNEPGPNMIHFPKEVVEYVSAGEKKQLRTQFSDTFFQQLCSERKIFKTNKKNPKGTKESKWVKLTSSTRNEVLDCAVYGFGLFEVCRQGEWIARKWKEVQAKLVEQNIPVPTGKPREYTLEVPKEEKLPELRKDDPARKPFPKRRKIRIGNPFNRRFGI